ncbi:single-stranded DNA-binding protein [Actinomycetaceae bacterium MB13-C1-2]|nr:single-stranded DNA-binding protein [Actinomycetaceae bacterium MB13-C1-2]
MANDTVITVVGNLTADPNLRYTQSGAAVADFTVASTPRTYDRNSGQFKDGETLFLRCSVWRDYAENVAESLSKGVQVIVQGRLVQRQYTPRDGGEQRTVVELQVDEVGPTLRWAKAQVQRTPRQGGSNFGGNGGNQSGNYSAPASPSSEFSKGGFGAPAGGQVDDPWGAPGNADFDQDPPF